MAALKKTETVNIRIDASTRDLIARAAEVAGKSVTAFMTEAAQAAAERELLEQRFFRVDAEIFGAIDDMLGQEGKVHQRLRGLLHARSAWLD